MATKRKTKKGKRAPSVERAARDLADEILALIDAELKRRAPARAARR